MRARKWLVSAAFVLCGVICCGGIAKAQDPDRIATFDSKIIVDRDRTLHVSERIAIINDAGAFDSGLHRRLWIKPLGPERRKPGWIGEISAKIDGQRATVRAVVDGKMFDISALTEMGIFSRARHVIELSYTAKYQFRIYHDYEELNLNVTGTNPVAVDRARVELHFPEGFPREAGVSASTDTGSHSESDCIRTDLPSGVVFETTHPLAPGSWLAFSSTFRRTGYFVTSMKEEGYRAIFENHPLLFPALMAIGGSIVFGIIGVIVWRRAPRSAGGLTDSDVATGTASPILWRDVQHIYRFPMVMFALAIIPGLNFTYSGHGGLSCFFVPLCFPWVIGKMLFEIATGSEESRIRYKRFFKTTIPLYVVLALPLSWLAVKSIHSTLGLEVSAWSFFAMMVSPFPWWYFY